VRLETKPNSVARASARPLTPERIRPLARTAFYLARRARAEAKARMGSSFAHNCSAPIFIIGCGRSGTTLLGELFAAHPEVNYIYEPYDLWAGVDPVTDFLQLYSRGDYHCLLDASSVTDSTKRRFRRLFATRPDHTLVEKSPINALRISFLDALEPTARFIHIVRDGVDVAFSIERLAMITRKMAFRPPLNEWWGVGDAKWVALERDGKSANYYEDEVGGLVSDAQRGAYEWLVSLREIETWREHLGSRICELRYRDLIDDPRRALYGLADSLGLSCPDSWLEKVTVKVRRAERQRRPALALPVKMCTDFNQFQASFGFEGRAFSEILDDGT
jgi:Sulfotransferase family